MSATWGIVLNMGGQVYKDVEMQNILTQNKDRDTKEISREGREEKVSGSFTVGQRVCKYNLI